MLSRVARNLTDYNRFYALVSFIFLAVMIIGALDLKQKSGYRIFFDESNPQLKYLDEKEAEFTRGDDIVFVLESHSKDILTLNNLKTLETITDEAWHIPNASRVNSLSNFQHSTSNNDDLLVTDLFDSEIHTTEADLANIRTVATTNPEIESLICARSGSSAVVQVKMMYSMELIERFQQRNESVDFAKEIQQKIEASNPDIKVYLIGRSLLNYTFEKLAEADVMTFIPIMFGLIIVLMMLLTRSFKATGATLLVIAFATIATHGFMGWIGFAMNQANSQTAVIVITICICNCIHLLNTLGRQLDTGLELKEALTKSLELNFHSITLTNITTIIGFMCLNFSSIPPYRELGNTVSFGIFSIWFFTLFLFPYLILAFKIHISERYKATKLAKTYTALLLRNRKLLLPIFVVVPVSLSLLMLTNEVNDDIIGYFSEDTEFHIGADYLQEEITGFDSLNLMIDTGVENGISDPEFLLKLDQFEQWLKQQPNVSHVKSISQIMKRLNRNMHGDSENYYRLPANKELAAQYLLLYELSLPYGLGLDEQINMDKSATLVSVTLNHATTNDIIAFEVNSEAWLRKNIPNARSNASGVSLMFAHIGYESIYSMLYGSMLALMLISIIIMIFMRSIKYGLISLIPNCLPGLVAFGIWAIIIGEVDMPAAVIFSVTLGIIVDDTVHFLGKYAYARKKLGYSTDQSIELAFAEVGGAIFITTVTLALGFLVLGFSDFVVNQTFGVMVAATITLALILDFILLPLVLKFIDNDNKETVEEPNVQQPLAARVEAS